MALQSLHPQAARRPMRLALCALAAFALAGCQLVPRPRAEGPQPAPDQQAEAPRVEEEAPLALPAGETRNRVALLVPLSGPNEAVGRAIANAANLALADSGSERIRITAYDTARGALEATNEALADGSGLFLGPLLAEDVRLAAPIASRAGVPVIAFSNDVSVAGEGVHVIGLNPAQAVARVTAFAAGRGARRFGALLPASVYGERAGRAFAAAVREAGGELVATRTYNRTPETLRTAAAALAAGGPFDAVLVADGARMAAIAAPALRRGAPDLRLLGTELWAAEGDAGAQAALRGAWFAGPPGARFEQLIGRYRARYGAAPPRLASLGYDAVLLAVRASEGWPLGRRFPARTLRSDDGFLGVDGAFRFARNGIAERALQVEEVRAGGTTILSPAPDGF